MPVLISQATDGTRNVAVDAVSFKRLGPAHDLGILASVLCRSRLSRHVWPSVLHTIFISYCGETSFAIAKKSVFEWASETR